MQVIRGLHPLFLYRKAHSIVFPTVDQGALVDTKRSAGGCAWQVTGYIEKNIGTACHERSGQNYSPDAGSNCRGGRTDHHHRRESERATDDRSYEVAASSRQMAVERSRIVR